MDLIGFVIPGKHVHHQIDAKTIGQFSLPFSGVTAPDRQQSLPVAIHSPGPSPFRGISRPFVVQASN